MLNPLSLFLALFLLASPAVPFAQEKTATLKVPGLQEAVEILRDQWGVSHMYAKNQHDLFFAQGYNAARDRLFQLEIWRRRTTGTMAEIQGAKALDRDIGARLLRFRLDLTTEMNHYHPQGEEIILAFVAGINAYITETETHPELLPIEFRLLGLTPQAWTPEVVISRVGGLFTNLEAELLMAQRVRAVGVATTKALVDLEPGNPNLVIARGLDLDVIPQDVLKYYLAARASVKFAPDDLVVPEARATRLFEQSPSLAITHDDIAPSANEGSNNWVLRGTKTHTGSPLMANDPHRAITAPSLRYWVHLVAPGWNVIGGGEPHLPGVSIGHNEHGAWGLTIFPTDSEDLYVYTTNPANPLQYRYKGKWERMTVRSETFPIKGQAPVTIDLKYTRHGPVLAEDHLHHRVYALRAAWLEIGATPYLASLRMDQATTWQEFRAACAYSQAPSENMVWADVKGNIGWQATGIVPRRRNWNGLLPVPGDGRFEWKGYLPSHAFPFQTNPPKGFLATANAENLPPRYPHAISYLWEPPYRQRRVEEVLNAGTGLTIDDVARLQTDELSIPARALVPLLRGLRSDNADVEAARENLLSWDYVLSQNSVAAGMYAAWQQQLWENFRQHRLPAASAQQYFPKMAPQRLLASLASPDSSYGPDPQAGRDRFLLESLAQAVQRLTERFGTDTSTWVYGQDRYHHITLRHPLTEAVNPQYRAQFDVGPLPRGGDGFTVNNTENNAAQNVGASFRIITDLADWDRALGVNTPGQSGNPADPHYRDLAPLWETGKYFPLFYSREKIISVTEQTLALQP